MALPANKHDTLFRLIVSDPGRAVSLLRGCLPAAAAACVDWTSSPTLVGEELIGREGKNTRCDALLRTRAEGGGEVYFLLEHKSYPDPKTAVQLIGYAAHIWHRQFRGGAGARLPLIVPVVFYHGTGRWTAPLSVSEMIAGPQGLTGIGRGLEPFLLVDLRRTDPASLSSDPAVEPGVLALALAGRRGVERDLLDRVVAGFDNEHYGDYLLNYVVEVFDLPRESLEEAMRRVIPEKTEEKMATVAEQFINMGRAEGKAEGEAKGRVEGKAEGRVEGKAEGRVEGKAEMLLRLLELKFKSVPPARRAQVSSAGIEELDAWTGSVLRAGSVDEVFGG